MSKISELREAVRNPPPERLCLLNSIGYQLNMMGLAVVCVILLTTTVWYIMFAFIFGILINWVGYKRERKQYSRIIEVKKSVGIFKEAEEDPSFTRKRFKIIARELGHWVKYLVIALISVPMWFFRDIGSQTILGKIGSVGLIIFIFIIIYLFPIYWLADLRKKFKRSKKK